MILKVGQRVIVSTGSLEQTRKYCGVTPDMELLKGKILQIGLNRRNDIYSAAENQMKVHFNWHISDLMLLENEEPIIYKQEPILFDPGNLII